MIPILILAAVLSDVEVLDIVKRAMNTEFRKQELVQQYTMKCVHVSKLYGKSGNVEKTESKAHEMLFVQGEPYQRLVEVNGKPLNADEERKQVKELKKFTEQRQKRAAERQKDRQEQQALLEEVPNAFDFKLIGEESIDGIGVWHIGGTRKASYKPRSKETELLSKLQGELWIEKSAYHVVRADLELMEPVSFGWFLAKLDRGAQFRWDFRRVNNEIWLPKQVNVEFDARLLGKKIRRRDETVMSDYKKFQVDSRVVSISEN